MAVPIAQILAGIQSPVDRIQQGVLFGQQQADRRTQQEAAQAQAVQQQAMNERLAEFSQKPNKTSKDFIDIMSEFPQLSEQFKRPLDALNDERKAATIAEATNVYAALSGGNSEAAIKILEDKKEAATNSGDAQAAQTADILIQTIKASPEAALTSAGLFLAQAQGADEFGSVLKTLEDRATARKTDPVNLRKTLADIGKTEAETQKILKEVDANAKAGFTNVTDARAAELGLDPKGVYQEGPDGKIFTVAKAPEIKDTTKDDKASVKELQDLEDEVDETLDVIELMIGPIGDEKRHAGLNAAVGIIDVMFPTTQADTRAFELLDKQLGGKNFMTAYQALKGGGTITEVEGQQAKDAQAAFNLAQDQDDYVAAVNRMRNLLIARVDKAKQRASTPRTLSFDAEGNPIG